MEIGLLQAGVRMIQSLDLDKDATDSMRRNPKYFGHLVLQKDIKDQLVLDQEPSDMHVFTWP